MLLIGLMLIRNENDVLAEVLAEHARSVDHIFVLDGTTEDPRRSREICAAYPNLTYYDEAMLPAGYPRPIRCGCLQFLVDAARARLGTEGWFVLLHGDELYVDSPRAIIAADGGRHECLMVESLLYFLHTCQAPFVYDPHRSLREQITWYAGPGYPEVRLFKNKAGTAFDPHEHYNLIPRGIGPTYQTHCKIRHYPYRDPVRQQERARDRTLVTQFSPASYRHVMDGRYYLDAAFFHVRHVYAWISNRPPRPRLATPVWQRALEDLVEHYGRPRFAIG